MERSQFRIEHGTARDVPIIMRLIKDLAEYERLAGEVIATEDALRDTLFGERPAADVLIAYRAAEPIGFAVFFQNYSTFLGRPGLHLEDLFVRPKWRGQGYGRELLAAVAALAVERGCGRLEWSVLDWNEAALGFYRKLGAQAMEQWTTHRLTGDALQRLGARER